MKQLYKWGGVIVSLLMLVSFMAGCKLGDDDEPTKYSVTVATDIAHGTLSVNTTSAESGTTIRITAAPAEGYELDSYAVADSNGNSITVKGGTFTMPKSNVVVSATFKETEATINQKAATAVIAKINAIGDVAYNDTSKGKIDDARTAYEALNAAQKALVPADTLAVLTTAETQYSTLKTEAETAAANQNAANAVIAKINAIGDVAYNDTSKGKIDDARTAYDALNAAQKALVPADTLTVLTTAETQYSTLKTEADTATANQNAANAVITKINAIGTVEYTTASKTKIDDARTAYEALNAAQKALVPVDTLAVLTTAETQYSTLKTEAETAAANQNAANAVIAKITAIGTVEYTTESKGKIDDARTAYEALNAAQKALVPADTLTVLTTAETQYSTLKTEAETAAANQNAANAVIAKITAIGRVAYTDACKALIDDARTAYNALTAAQKELVTNYGTLTEAESTYESLITYTVTITGGANATVSGGATTQSDLNGAMTTVTYTASNGYYFADFTATTTNGITLTRTSSSVVTVSGTPTTDTSITVPDAAQIELVTAITLNKTSTTISAGSTETLSVSAYEPGNATFQTVTWSSNNTAVATVDTTGLVTAVAAGENGSSASATITATATDGSDITATCTVTVTPASVDVDNRGFTARPWEDGIGGNLTTE